MHKKISLNGAWDFQESGSEAWYEGQVPGCVQLDLLRLGLVPDPFYRLNEVELHRLEEKEWVYRREFTLKAEDLEHDEIDLVFEGIDTLAEIYLNDSYLGRAENMFIPQYYEVTDLLEEGENRLEVRFLSPLTTIKAMERTSPLQLKSSCESARPYIRKAQYSYGWDWGPRIAQVGLWRSVYLEFLDQAVIVDPFCYTEKITGDDAEVRVVAEVDSFLDEEEQLLARITFRLDGAVQARTEVPVVIKGGGLGLEARLTIPHARLWWPNGLGDQPLYEVTVQLLHQGQVVDERAFQTGLRTVQLIQEHDAEGQSFIFCINGVKVFAKGADWVPADNLLPRLTEQDYDEYIRLAQEAHMNMLRIWGGGIYEDPAFYRACDRRGIMVWQDFMYACAQYPDELDWFQKLAEEEAELVVRRLRNHPCLVLWCGNNENNWGFDEWWHNGEPKYLGNYIYREILPRICADLDPSRPYWVSSPWGWTKPNSMSDGDRHSWLVWSSWQDYQHYAADTGRFISEFGFQAMPTWKTVLSFTAPEDRSILSPVILGHQKMVEGTERLVRFLVGRIGFPKDFRSFVYLTQLNQAEAIRFGVEHWRLRKFMTSGALYWQLNDCWPVASWSCLDYYKRKKALYHYSRRFFDQILPVVRHDGEQLVVRVVNDTLQQQKAWVRLRAYRLDGTKLGELKLDTTLPANDVATVGRFKLEELGIGYTPAVQVVDIPGTTLPQECNGELLNTVIFVTVGLEEECYTNYFLFDRFRALKLVPPPIQVKVEGTYITLSSPVPAFGVVVEAEHDVDLSPNWLVLEPGVPQVIACSAAPGQVEVFDLTRLVSKI
jgi:beta-mannosidase